MPRIKIAHLSDLHMRANGRQDAALALQECISRLKPNLILVTGDLVDSPLIPDLTYSHNFLMDLCRRCGLEIVESANGTSCKSLLVVPGNHDVKYVGNFDLYFNRNHFRNLFGHPQFQIMDELNLGLFGFDSTTTAKASFARGNVGDQSYVAKGSQYANFSAFINDNISVITSRNLYKIAYLHHHPVPIADLEGIEASVEPFLELSDSGTFIREMLKAGIDLILHGHKHYPNIIQLLNVSQGKHLYVLGAGSACKPIHRSSPIRSFNFITISGNHEVILEKYIYTTGTYQKALAERTVLRSYDSFRSVSLADAERSHGAYCSSAFSNIIIGPCGDSLRYEEQAGIKVVSPDKKLRRAPIAIENTFGLIRGLIVRHNNNPCAFEGEYSADGSTAHGDANFGREHDINSPTFKITTQYWQLNGNALTMESLNKLRDNPLEDESWDEYSYCVRIPTRSFRCLIHFTNQIELPNVRVRVLDMNNNRVYIEEEYVQAGLVYAPLSASIYFQVDSPLYQHKYIIQWMLPPDPYTIKNKPAAIQTYFRDASDCLLGLRRLNEQDPKTKFVKSALAHLNTLVCDTLQATEEKDEIESSVMAFGQTLNDSHHRWRIVGLSTTRNENIWNFDLKYGEGVAGRAEKARKRYLHVKELADHSPEKSYYVNIPGETNHFECVLSIPIFYPLDWAENPHGQALSEEPDSPVLAVVNISTRSRQSALISLNDKNPRNDRFVGRITQAATDCLASILGECGISKILREDFQ